MGSILPSGIQRLQQLQAQAGPQGQLRTAPSRGSSIAQAMQQLMTGAVNFHEGLKKHNLQLYQNAVQSIVDGTNPNPDYKKILEWGKKAGLPIKTEVTPEDAQAQMMTRYQNQAAPQNQAAGLQGGIPGMPGVNPQQLQAPGQPPMPPTAGPGPAPPSRLMRIFQGAQRYMGMNGGQQPVDVNSPAGQLLQNLAKARGAAGGLPAELQGQAQDTILSQELAKLTKNLGLQNAKNGLQLSGSIFQGALQGDPKSTEILHKFGQLQQTPIDTIERAIQLANPSMPLAEVQKQAGSFSMYLQNGGPVLKGKMIDLSKDMSKNFGNNPLKAMQFLQDPTDPTNQPALSAEDFDKLWSGVGKVQDAMTGVPSNVAGAYGMAVVHGKDDLANTLLDWMSKTYPRQNTTDANLRQQQISNDFTGIRGNLFIGQQRADTERLSGLLKGLDDSGALAEDVFKDHDKFTPQQYLDAARLSATKNNAVAGLLQKYGFSGAPQQTVREMGGLEKGANMFGPATPTLGGVAPPSNFTQGFTGQQPTGQQLLQTPQGMIYQQLLKNVDPNIRQQTINNTQMDPAYRQALNDWAVAQQQAAAAAQQSTTQQGPPPTDSGAGIGPSTFGSIANQ
jgi:hypothetical protein